MGCEYVPRLTERIHARTYRDVSFVQWKCTRKVYRIAGAEKKLQTNGRGSVEEEEVMLN